MKINRSVHEEGASSNVPFSIEARIVSALNEANVSWDNVAKASGMNRLELKGHIKYGTSPKRMIEAVAQLTNVHLTTLQSAPLTFSERCIVVRLKMGISKAKIDSIVGRKGFWSRAEMASSPAGDTFSIQLISKVSGIATKWIVTGQGPFERDAALGTGQEIFINAVSNIPNTSLAQAPYKGKLNACAEALDITRFKWASEALPPGNEGYAIDMDKSGRSQRPELFCALLDHFNLCPDTLFDTMLADSVPKKLAHTRDIDKGYSSRKKALAQSASDKDIEYPKFTLEARLISLLKAKGVKYSHIAKNVPFTQHEIKRHISRGTVPEIVVDEICKQSEIDLEELHSSPLTFGQRCIIARLTSNRSITDFSLDCDTSYSQWSKIEEGRSEDSGASPVFLASKLSGLSTIWLATGKGPLFRKDSLSDGEDILKSAKANSLDFPTQELPFSSTLTPIATELNVTLNNWASCALGQSKRTNVFSLDRGSSASITIKDLCELLNYYNISPDAYYEIMSWKELD